MANVTCERRRDKTLYRVEFYDADRRRKKIRLGSVTKRDAESIASRIDELVSASIAGTPPRPALAEWITSLGDDLHAKLASAGLIEARKTTTLGPFVDEWLERQKADNAASTIKNLQPFVKGLFEFFGRDRDIRTITVQDADNWRRSLAERYAKATVAKRIKVTKQVFRSAVRLNVITHSPFSATPVGSQVNDTRNRMIPMQWIHRVLEQEKDPEFRLIIMLARVGGLRTPSEPLQLRWEDIDWAEGTFVVRSPKTRRHQNASRCVPLFPELEPFLSDVYHRAPEGATYVITKYRDSAVNLRTRFERAILRAGLQPWPRLFQNCRSSRETELADAFPIHTVCQWLGHSPKISLAHYLKTTKEHIARANGRAQQGGGATGGAAANGNQENPAASTVQKTSGNQASAEFPEGNNTPQSRPGGIRTPGQGIMSPLL